MRILFKIVSKLGVLSADQSDFDKVDLFSKTNTVEEKINWGKGELIDTMILCRNSLATSFRGLRSLDNSLVVFINNIPIVFYSQWYRLTECELA